MVETDPQHFYYLIVKGCRDGVSLVGNAELLDELVEAFSSGTEASDETVLVD